MKLSNIEDLDEKLKQLGLPEDEDFEKVYKEMKSLTSEQQDDQPSLEAVMKEIKAQEADGEIAVPATEQDTEQAAIETAAAENVAEITEKVMEQPEIPSKPDTQTEVQPEAQAEVQTETAEEIPAEQAQPDESGMPIEEGETVNPGTIGDKSAIDKLFHDFEKEPQQAKGFLKNMFSKAMGEQMDEEPDANAMEESEYEDYSDEGNEEDDTPREDDYKKLGEKLNGVMGQLRARYRIALVAAIALIYISLGSLFHLPLPDALKPTVNAAMNMFVCLILYLAVLVAGHKEIINGIRSAIALKAEPDSILAYSAVIALLHGLLQIKSVFGSGTFLFFGGVVAVVLTVTLKVKVSRLENIYDNLTLIKRIGSKNSMERINDPKLLDKLVGKAPTAAQLQEIDALMNAVQEQKPAEPEDNTCKQVVYEGKVEKTFDFEEIAFSIDESHYFSTYATPVAVAVTILLGILFGVVKKSLTTGLDAFAVFSVMAAPFTLEMAYTVPYNHLAKRFRRHGTVALGSSAIRRLYDCDGVVVEDSYIFDKGSVYLKSMKFFGDVHIDQVFIDMASVLSEMKCAVAGVFLDSIQHDTSLLRPVENWDCERGQGVVATMADGQHLYIGKKDYMEENGFDIPDVFNIKGAEIGGNNNMLYVGSQSRVYGAFEICYTAGPEITSLMEILHNNNVTVFFKSCDVFLDNQFMKENFNINVESFRTVDDETYMDVEELMDKVVEGTSGIYMRKNDLENLADIICECKRMQGVVKRNLYITLASIIGAPLIAFILMSRIGVTGLNFVYMLIIMVIWIIPLIVNSHE